MNAKKLIAISWWTFAYALMAGTLFAFSSLGDCFQSDAECRAQSSRFTDALLLSEVIAYAILTWLIFFRRR